MGTQRFFLDIVVYLSGNSRLTDLFACSFAMYRKQKEFITGTENRTPDLLGVNQSS